MAWETEGMIDRMVGNSFGDQAFFKDKKKKKKAKKKKERLVEVPQIEIDHTKEQSELDKLKKKMW